MPQDLLAALDLGSNTFRLILARLSRDVMAGASRRVWQEIPRISEGLVPGGRLLEAPKARAWAALEGFQRVIEEHAPAAVLAGATMAFREASDGGDFLAEAGRRFGWRAIVLSGEEEARLSALGVLSGLDPTPEDALIFDIGGRSTELINTREEAVVLTQSLPMGVVGLTERHVSSDPPSAAELAAIRRHVVDVLRAADWSRLGQSPTLIGTAGTVTTVAAMLLELADYDPALINNQPFDRARIGGLLSKLAALKSEERAALPGLHPRRADVIVAGLIEVTSIMDFLGLGRLVVSDNSLLEGLWLAAAGLVKLRSDKFTEVAP
jgi:exopolyphosphatase/guanosine-5'-triphosphate,3'-diphosphate pyrophosphatase